MIGRKQPPTIQFNPPPPPTMQELALKFAYSWNSYLEYVEELKLERQGLNLVSVAYVDLDTGESYDEVITQRELDARMALWEFNMCMIDEDSDLLTYDQLLVDSDEEYDDYDYEENDSDWQKA